VKSNPLLGEVASRLEEGVRVGVLLVRGVHVERVALVLERDGLPCKSWLNRNRALLTRRSKEDKATSRC